MPRVLGLSHVGIFVRDLQRSKDFYSRILGLTVTDESDWIVFLSAQPESEHHELALIAGREAPPGTAVVQQISFRVPSLADLREYYQRLVAEGVPIQRQTTHGIALGLYFYDPDGNPVEVFWDTGIKWPQPFNVPLDFSKSEEEILAAHEAALAAARPEAATPSASGRPTGTTA
ncbi:MAG: VOC family protein [Chloroflexi bacterium]|jgi:catechol-2,3-dioxygenase|nr:VOC family protein [Chloroflexota bacterium]